MRIVSDKAVRFHASHSNWRFLWYEQLLVIALALLLIVQPASAAMRFQERSLFIRDVTPAAVTDYTVSFKYMSLEPVASLDMLFCIDPIPHHACVAPEGIDASGAVLAEQAGEVGFSILSKTSNHIVLTRNSKTIDTDGSTYRFDNIVNPVDTDQSFSIRLRSHSTPDAMWPQIDFGSVKGQVTNGIVIETQVPPMLIFCLAEEVGDNCETTNGNFYTNMGELNDKGTLTAQSQMAVGTNASAGYVITVNGTPPSAGTSVIDPISTPTESIPGINQFGINLAENNSPVVGHDPQGVWTNAVAANDYATADMFKFVPGDVVAYSPNVSLMRKFTVSYVLNSSYNLKPGVYSTTITYIASGRF